MNRRNFLLSGLAASATAALPLTAQAAPKSLSIEEAIRESYPKAADVMVKYLVPNLRLEYRILQDLKGNPLKWVYLNHSSKFVGEREIRYEVSEAGIATVAPYIEQCVGVIRQEAECLGVEEGVPILLFVGEDRYQVDPHTLNCTLLS